MKIQLLERVFTFQDSQKNDIILEDINPDFSLEQVLNHYSQLYPELTTAKINDKGIVEGKNKIEFQTIAGTKG